MQLRREFHWCALCGVERVSGYAYLTPIVPTFICRSCEDGPPPKPKLPDIENPTGVSTCIYCGFTGNRGQHFHGESACGETPHCEFCGRFIDSIALGFWYKEDLESAKLYLRLLALKGKRGRWRRVWEFNRLWNPKESAVCQKIYHRSVRKAPEYEAAKSTLFRLPNEWQQDDDATFLAHTERKKHPRWKLPFEWMKK